MSAFFRCWAKRQARCLSEWLNDFLPEGAHGARPEHSAADCAWKLQTRIAKVNAQQQPLYILSLDQRQCFDNLSLKNLEQMMQLLNAPTRIRRCLEIYSRIRRVLMVEGIPTGHVHAGPNIDGIPQGCPLAAAMCTIVSALWELQLKRELGSEVLGNE